MEFADYLEELRDASVHLSVGGLQRLDSLTREQAELLAAVWPEVHRERKRWLVRQLVELAEDNVDLSFDGVFLTALEDEDREIRREAIQGLWEYEAANLVPRLLRLLEKDEEPEVRSEAALALGRYVMKFATGDLGERHFVEVEKGLRRTLEDDLEEESVRARALEAIGACDRPWVRDAIRQAYEGEEPRIRLSALHAMGRSCQPRWLPALLEELTSEDPASRYEAALALGSLEDRRTVSHLAPLVGDPDPEVKEAAIVALGRIGGREAKSVLRPLLEEGSPSVREAAAAALAEADFDVDPLSVEYRL